ncbi:unnamed protein product [Adineta steineri]|uniref:Tubulin/FtsZ GTPase domain-containing protein n=2 Tax=Adineta steineri TaxID=433720 RepID=A0A815LWV3_9BILA|nr:unnamed protein product [Adineta steineri]
MFNITVENMNLQSTSAGIKVSAYDRNSTGNMYDMIFRNVRITDTNRGLCVAPRWGSNIISNLLFEHMTIETRFFGLDWWGSAEPIYVTGLSTNADQLWTGMLKNITFRNIIAKGEQGFIVRGNTSILENIHFENISLTIARWSNVTEHPSHDYRPSQEPQMAWAKVDGIFAMDIDRFYLQDINIDYQQPKQSYYGQCLNLTGDDCIAIISHGPSSMFNITVENMNLQSTSAGIKVSAYDKNSTGNMYDMTFRNVRITDTNRGLCVAPRWGSNIISNLLFEHMNIETRFFGLDWWGSAEPIYVTGLSTNADQLWTGVLKNITFRNIIAKGEQGFIVRGNTSILENIHFENISLTIARWSNVTEHPSHDYRPSQEPQMAWAKVDGIFAMDIDKFYLQDINIDYQQPKQSYYGQCLNLSNITQMVQNNIQCQNIDYFISGQNSIEKLHIGHKYTPRMLYIDFETTVLDEVRSGSYRQLFHPDRIISGKGDAASNYARGYFTLGQKLIDYVLEQIRRITNHCHSLQGFLIFHSFGGSTGSGFTSLLMEHLNINYSKKTCFEFVIFPSPKLSTIITEPYNTVLNTHISLEYADCVFIVDNEALWDICTYSLNIEKGNFVHINRLLAQVISNITANSRFKEGNIIDLNEFLTNLVPFPRIHFPLVS